MPAPVSRFLLWLARIAIILGLVWCLYTLSGWVMAQTHALDSGAQLRVGLLVLLLLAYALLIAVPFVPGIEIGLSLLMLGGDRVAPFVYLATIAGLMLAYGVGQRVAPGLVARWLDDLGLRRASGAVARLGRLTPQQRIDTLRLRLPARLAPHLLRFRHILLALLINLPGNAVIGGGGGICLLAGMSRLYAPAPMLLTLALAVAPVPLLIWAIGRPLIAL